LKGLFSFIDKEPRPICSLAPLAGFTDYPFRKLCLGLGADYSVTEMVSSEALVRKNPKTLHMIKTIYKEPRTLVQLMGATPRTMAEAARISEAMGAPGIDINMGCPERKINRQGAGAALLKDPDLAKNIVEEVVKAVTIPVTVKMRLGWKKGEVTALGLSREFQSLGARLIVIHARSRDQMFRPRADWKALYPIKKGLSVPLIANGDVVDGESAQRCLFESGADGVMVGRGALGRPWVFKEIRDALRTQPGRSVSSARDTIFSHRETVITHLDAILSYYGRKGAIRPMRLHLMWYSKGIRGGSTFRRAIGDMTSPENMMKAFLDLLKRAQDRLG